jgi:hypothetical protein
MKTRTKRALALFTELREYKGDKRGALRKRLSRIERRRRRASVTRNVLEDISAIWSYVHDDVINEPDINPFYVAANQRVENWISEQYCKCRCPVPYVVSTGEVRCQLCGKLTRQIITIGTTGG